jgi:hypothetical protein
MIGGHTKNDIYGFAKSTYSKLFNPCDGNLGLEEEKEGLVQELRWGLSQDTKTKSKETLKGNSTVIFYT